MILKKFMCCCSREEFRVETVLIKKKLIHFHCKCKEKHFYYVLFCKNNPFGAGFVAPQQTKRKCNCKSGFSHEVCRFCFSIRYLLNVKRFKICEEDLPDYFIGRVVSSEV